MSEGLTSSADYEHISVALHSFWKPFEELLNEIDSFVPHPLTKFDDIRNRKLEKFQGLNPDKTADGINEFVSREMASLYSPRMQFESQFADRFMTMYVTVTLLSQALCEAVINLVLAVGLQEIGLVDQFEKIEKAGIKTKWVKHPKLFCPNYDFSKDSELYKTLDHLIEERNAWMHHKIQLSVGEETILNGSIIARDSYQERIAWMKRFFSLPYDLTAIAFNQTQQIFLY
jgi:hypothetical protein